MVLSSSARYVDSGFCLPSSLPVSQVHPASRERNSDNLTPPEALVETTKTELEIIWNGLRQEEREALDFSLVFISRSRL